MGNGFVEGFNAFSRWVFEFQSSYSFQALKWIVVVYSLVLFFCIFYLSRKYFKSDWEFYKYGGKRPVKKAEVAAPGVVSPWEPVEGKLEAGSSNDWKIAVIEADKMLDERLKRKGFPGEDMGGRLKGLVDGDVGGDLQAVWWAHKIRNMVVHDTKFFLTNEDARKVVAIMRRAWETLGE